MHHRGIEQTGRHGNAQYSAFVATFVVPRVAILFHFCLVAGLLVEAGRSSEVRGESIDVTPRRLPTVAPGTVIRSEAPEGWTHLIIKSGSRIAAGDIERLSDSEKAYARLFSTVIVANVERRSPQSTDQGNYRLSRVAVGCLTSIHREDTVISPDSHKRLGADLGFLGGMLLGEICKKQQGVLVVARSDTMAIIDSPVVVRYKEVNRLMVFRYGLLVDATQGTLECLVWLCDPEATRSVDRVPGMIERLGENHVEEFPLHVDGNHYKFGIPTERTFGVMNLPSGTSQLPVPDALRNLLGHQTYTSARFVDLRARLIALLAEVDGPAPTDAGRETLDERRARLHEPLLRSKGRQP